MFVKEMLCKCVACSNKNWNMLWRHVNLNWNMLWRHLNLNLNLRRHINFVSLQVWNNLCKKLTAKHFFRRKNSYSDFSDKFVRYTFSDKQFSKQLLKEMTKNRVARSVIIKMNSKKGHNPNTGGPCNSRTF